MTANIFKNLRDRYQILDHIPIRTAGKFEKCYSGKTTDVSMYDAMFTAGLRLPLTALHCKLANFLGLSISQIAPNAWRIFIGAEILQGRLSGGNRQLSLDEFFQCYRLQHIVSSQGIYHFTVRRKRHKLVSDMPDSNRNWKGRYFLSKGWIGYVIQKNGWRCLMVLTTLEASSRTQVQCRLPLPFSSLIFFKFSTSSTFFIFSQRLYMYYR